MRNKKKPKNLERIILNFILFLSLALYSFSANAKETSIETSNEDTMRIVLVLSPFINANHDNVENELVLEAYRRLENGLEASNQMFGGLNEEALKFLDQRDFVSLGQRSPLAKVVKTIVLDTLSNANSITSVLLAALDTDSELYEKNQNLKDNIAHANGACIVTVVSQSELETATVAGATGGKHIVIVQAGNINVLTHEIGHFGVLPDTTINSAGDTTILRIGIGHDYWITANEDYSLEINGVLDTVKNGTKSYMSPGMKDKFFSTLSANGVAYGLKDLLNLWPHFEDKRFFIDVADPDGNIIIDTTDAESIYITSMLKAFAPDENIYSWIRNESMDNWYGIPKELTVYDKENNLVFEDDFIENEIVSSELNLEQGENSYQIEMRLPGTGEKLVKQIIVHKRVTSSIAQVMDNLNVNVHPNPTSGSINLNTSENLNFQVNLYDINGTLLISQSNVNQVNLDGIISGTYFLEITDKKTNQNIVEKIIVEN